MDIKQLDTIINKTLNALEEGKKQIYDIAENIWDECQHINKELENIKTEVAQIIKIVGQLEHKEKKARLWLMEVSRNFSHFSEEDIKKAYNQAQQVQLELVNQRHKESMARFKRDRLERRLKELTDTQAKAEKMISHLGVALSYLSKDLQLTSQQINELQEVQQLGINIIRAQEEERRRVAREIHDGPAQVLANIVMRAEFCLKLLELQPSRVRNEIIVLLELVRQSLQDVRKIIFDLRPMVLDDLGLIPALNRYLSEYKSETGIETELVSLGKLRRLPSTIEVAIFRIIQESLSNIHKHAQAHNVTLKIEMLDDKINVKIQDDGQGFDLEAVKNNKGVGGYGLANMRERTSLLQGRIDIESIPSKGTTINLTIPVKEWGHEV